MDMCEHQVPLGKYCRKCYDRQWYQKNREKRDKQIKRWKSTNPGKVRQISGRGRIKRAYKEAVRLAEVRQLSFTLTQEMYQQLTSQACYYCLRDTGDSGVRLDRIDNQLGYQEDNVLSCCGRCNLIRSNKLTVSEMKAGMTELLSYWRRRDAK